MYSEDILDTSQFDFKDGFNEQVNKLLLHIRLNRCEVENLKKLFTDLLQVFRQVWPGCQVNPFGSIVTGLGIQTSDVDIYVDTYSNNIHPVYCVQIARNLLHKCPHLFREIFAITSAKVPIVKFYHTKTKRYSDVNFTSLAGVRNSNLIACLLETDTRALNLAVLVKYWSKVHKLTGTNLVPNYGMTLLVIFYLQQKMILPSIRYMQNHVEPFIVDNWNTAFDEFALRQININETLYELLGDFFQFYANFDFEGTVISTYLGRAIDRNDFKNPNEVPYEYNTYQINVTMGIYKPIRLDTKMCVQDPFEHCRNCTVMVYPKLYEKLLTCIKLGMKAFEDKDDKTFLKKILVDSLQESVAEVPSMPANKHTFKNKIMKNYRPLIKKNVYKERFKSWKNQKKGRSQYK